MRGREKKHLELKTGWGEQHLKGAYVFSLTVAWRSARPRRSVAAATGAFERQVIFQSDKYNYRHNHIQQRLLKEIVQLSQSAGQRDKKTNRRSTAVV